MQHIRKVYTMVSKLIGQCCTLSLHVHWHFECYFQVTHNLVRATALGWLLDSLNPKKMAGVLSYLPRSCSQVLFTNIFFSFIPQEELNKEIHGSKLFCL